MPDPGDHLRGGGVPEVKVVDELDDSKRVRGPLGVSVAPFGSVAKEGHVAERVYFFLVPFPWIPGEVIDKARFKDLECCVLLVDRGRVSGYFERGVMPFLRENSN